MKRIVLLSVMAVLLVGCASDYHTSLEDSNEGKVGSLQLDFSFPMQDVNVIIDNEIVAQDRSTDQIKINNVPIGTHNLLITGSGNGRKDWRGEKEITISTDTQNTQLIKTLNGFLEIESTR